MKTELQERADILAINLHKSVDVGFEVLRSIGQFYASSERVRRQDFQSFVQPALIRHPSIHALEWLPRLSQAERPGFEQRVRAEGYANFQITERTAEGKIIRAGQRQDYFPVSYVEPLVGNELALGFDLASDATRWSALQKARDTGATVASGRIELVQETSAAFGFLVALPIYRPGAAQNTLATRRENLQGFILGVFRIADIIQASLPGLDLDHLDFYLYDKSSKTDEGFLAFYNSNTRQVLAAPKHEKAAVSTYGNRRLQGEFLYQDRNICTRVFNVTDRQWSLLVLPRQGYMDRAELYNQSRITADAATAQAKQLRQALQNLQHTQARWSLEKQLIGVGVGLVVLILGSVSLVSYRNMERMVHNAARVERSQAVLLSLSKLLSATTDPEQTRSQTLKVQAIEQAVKTLQQATAGRDPQPLDSLESLIARKLAFLKASGNATGSTLQSAPADRALQAEIRATIAAIEGAENAELQFSQTEPQANLQDIVAVSALGIALCVVLLYGVYYLLHRQIAERSSAEAALCQVNDELETKIQAQTVELDHTRELSELKLRFFSMASHEFRTPLSIILVAVQALENRSHEWPAERRLKYLHRVRSAAKMMAHLLSDILTLTRAEVGKLECRPEPLNLEQFCTHLLEEIRLSTDAQQNISFVSQGQCANAYLDEKLLHSILANLLSNAIKYSAADSQIQFSVSCKPAAVIFQVRDQGIGILPDDQRHLYETFYRGANVGNISGTGLGLAVVKTCVALHGGQIMLESESGVGTTFSVTLPLNRPAPVSQP